MSTGNPTLPPESPPNRVGPVFVVVFMLIALGNALLSLVFWVLGVGVQQQTHNLIGGLFVAVNVLCIFGGVHCLKKGSRIAAIASVLLALPVCISAVAVAAYVFHV